MEGVSQPPCDDVIRELSRSLQQELGVSLFGIDVIINNQTGQHAIIDINAFPGMCNLFIILMSFMKQKKKKLYLKYADRKATFKSKKNVFLKVTFVTS